MKPLFYSAMLCLMVSASSVFAGQGASQKEAAILIKVADEITYLQSLLDKAEGAQHRKSTIKVNYDNLDKDLKDIKEALIRHAKQPKRSPRKIHPLRKNYVR